MSRWVKAGEESYEEPIDVLQMFYERDVDGKNVKYLVELYDYLYDNKEKSELIARLQRVLDQDEPTTQSSILARLIEEGHENIAEQLKSAW